VLAGCKKARPKKARPNGVLAADEWRLARSHLAARVLELAETDAPLEDVQRSVLVPLELELASRAEVAWWGPGQLVASVEAALSWHCGRSDVP
jgi:hypothetical protein